MPKLVEWLLLAACVCVPLLQAMVLVRDARELRRQFASRAWPNAEATILESRIEEDWEGDAVSYTPKILYAFTVEGRTYRASKIYFGVSGVTRRTAERLVRRFPQGTVALAHYDAADPTCSVLERTLGPLRLYMLGVHLVLGVVSYACVSSLLAYGQKHGF